MTRPHCSLHRHALTLAVLLLGGGSASAQPLPSPAADPGFAPADDPNRALPPSRPAALPAAPEAIYRALRGRIVTVRQRRGPDVTGQLAGFEPGTITIIANTGDVVALPTADIVGVRSVIDPVLLGGAAPLDAAPRAPREPPAKERYFGIHLGIAPSLMIDLQYSYFYTFANASIVFPLATAGSMDAFALGFGVSFPLARDSHWKFDIFASATPARFGTFDGYFVGVGLGLGVHYTMRSGFSFGVKAPIIGYALGLRFSRSDEAVADFYASAGMGLPLLSFGYRF